MPCGATQDRRVMVERSDRMWSTREGNGKPLQYSCLESPMNSMKKHTEAILNTSCDFCLNTSGKLLSDIIQFQYLATWCEELTQWKRPWFWERLKARGEGDDRGWDVWMASLTRRRWVWVSSGNWWWTGKPGMLLSVGSRSQTWLRDWNELNW